MSSNKRIFITGGASGLGRALAERYAKAGYRVLIGDINDDRLAETVAVLRALGATAEARHCDVRQEADFEAAAAWLQAEWGGVDIVVNNAGVAVAGGIAELPIDDWQWVIDINLLGVVRGCKVFTPVFRKQGSGHFVNVASLAGLVHPPHMAAYAATKAAVVAISESILLELGDEGIHVSVVCPSFFRTNLHETARTTSSDLATATKRLLVKSRMGPDEVAAKVFKAVQKREFVIQTHADGRVAWAAKRVLPFAAYKALVKSQAKTMLGG